MSYLLGTEILTRFDAIGMCLILIRLAQRGLTRRFRYFVSLLALDLAGLLTGWIAGSSSWTYCKFWEYSQLVGLVVVPLCFCEMFQDLYAKHPGLAAYSRSVLRRTLLLGTTAAFVSLPFSQRTFACEWGFDCWIYRFIGLKVFIVLSATLFTPALLLYLNRLDGVHLDRNTKVYATAFTSHTFIACIGSLLLIFLNSAAVAEAFNVVFLILNIGCQVVWIAGLTRSEPPSRAVDASEERMVFEQLRRMRVVVDEMEQKARLRLGRR